MNSDPVIKIVDVMMGGGKSSWAIQYMNQNPQKTFLYVTPFLTEIDRIKSATNGRFFEPQNRGDGKLDGLKSLLAAGKDIAVTHQLLLHLDEEAKNLLHTGGYTCILDEELDVVKSYGDVLSPTEKEDYKIKTDDVRYIVGEGLITIEPVDRDGKTGFVRWTGPHGYDNFQYSRIRDFAEAGTLICVDGAALFWMYPPDVFGLFEEVFVLTYQVEGSILYSYLLFHGLSFKKLGICGDRDSGYHLCEYSAEADRQMRSAIAPLLHILGKL